FPRAQIVAELRARPDRVPERKAFAAAEKQTLLDVAVEREREPRVDAELADGCNAVAQTAQGETIEAGHATPGISFGVRLQRLFGPQIVFEPWRQDRARGQSGDA